MKSITASEQTRSNFGFPEFGSIAARRDMPLQIGDLQKQPSVLELRANAIDNRVAAIDQRLAAINERLASLNQSAPSTARQTV